MKDRLPATQGVRFLKQCGVSFEGHPYKHEGPVYLDESALAFDMIYINGGAKGSLVSLSPADMVRLSSGT